MKARTLKTLWFLTLLTALGLLVTTMRVAAIAGSDEILVGKVVTLAGRDNLVFLRSAPSRGANVTTTVPQGTQGRVAELTVSDGQETWFLVETVDGPGWVPGIIVEWRHE